MKLRWPWQPQSALAGGRVSPEVDAAWRVSAFLDEYEAEFAEIRCCGNVFRGTVDPDCLVQVGPDDRSGGMRLELMRIVLPEALRGKHRGDAVMKDLCVRLDRHGVSMSRRRAARR